MKPRITFTGASAGSGKTRRVTNIIQSQLLNATCRPSGLIATTYTKKAAQDLRDRLRHSLHVAGRHALAERLDEGMIGTVHSICRIVLERFAFEAGISPRVEVLDDGQAAEILAQALDIATEFKDLKELQRLARRLGEGDPRGRVRGVIQAAQANDFSPESLPDAAKRSVEELFTFLPRSSRADLNAGLVQVIKKALRQIKDNGDSTKGTADYVGFLRGCLRDLDAGRMRWSDWIKLTKDEPTKKSRAAAQPIQALAARVEEHAGLRADIEAYTKLVFSLAQRALQTYQSLKQERGMHDFTDLEQRTYHLLRGHSGVRNTLEQELDLLVVDEFQDTSPIQLALFMQLAACAKETFWVGDVKQAIYGFRCSDPELLTAVVKHVKTSGTFTEPLSDSYRATPELVTLTNALFTPAFAESLGLNPSEVCLTSKRESISRSQAAVEFHELSSGQFTQAGTLKRLENAGYVSTLVEGLARMLERKPPIMVCDKNAKKEKRMVMMRDLAVLCRTNDRAAEIAGALRQRGLAVTLSQSGLLATPEARLAMACLRRLADPADTLATAEIVALEGKHTPEEWLESRLKHVAAQEHSSETGGANGQWGIEEPFIYPAIVALEKAREGLNRLTPSEALEAALNAANIFATVSSWGPGGTRAAQRRANLEALRALVVKYEEACAGNHAPATLNGFLIWCDELARANADLQAADRQLDAIHVGTYHGAKGLEWPVVVCADLDYEPRPRLWQVTTIEDDPAIPFDASHPLANRRPRFWVWPFGQHKSGVPLLDRINASEAGREAQRRAADEELRLLYVGLTRARDLLVLVTETDQPSVWLDRLNACWLRPRGKALALPDGEVIPVRNESLTPPTPAEPAKPEGVYHWFRAPMTRTPKLPAGLVPSEQEALPGARIGRIVDFGARLPLSGRFDEGDLGDALHAILAVEFVNPSNAAREACASRILGGLGLADYVKMRDVLAMVDRLRSRLDDLFKPRSILVETPFETTNTHGQRLSGFIDLLLETSGGWVVIDHKSFPGARNLWTEKALSYSGQLQVYALGLRNAGRVPAGTWIHFAVGGGLAEVIGE
jgi:ATP-dependent exoDNAse (exonuclease V) beta subunit